MRVFQQAPKGRLTVWLIVAVAASGCNRPAGPDVVAVIGGREVHYQQFSDYVAANVGTRAEGLRSQVLSSLFDEFLNQEIADTIAAVEVPPGTPSDRIFEVWVDGLAVAPPTPTDLRARYRQKRGRYSLPRRAVLRQIVVGSVEEARAVRQELEAGADFSAVADRLRPEGEYAPAGGLQGAFAAADLPRQVAAAVFDLEPRQVSNIVEMEHGYALFEVDRFIEAEEQSFEEVREELAREIAAEKRQQALEERVASYRIPENVTIYPANLPFDYGGVYEDFGG